MDDGKKACERCELIAVERLCENVGQIEGIPANPRKISDEKFQLLKKSLEESPEMLALRELIVVPWKDGKFVVVAGNMRLKAGLELGFREMPCKVLAADADPRKIAEYLIKDNSAFGQWDMGKLLEDWGDWELEDWGVDLPKDAAENTEADEIKEDTFRPICQILIECQDEAQQEKVYQLIQPLCEKEGVKCRV